MEKSMPKSKKSMGVEEKTFSEEKMGNVQGKANGKAKKPAAKKK